MSFIMTYHGSRSKQATGDGIDALGPQIGNAIPVAPNYTFTQGGLYRCRATADHTVRFGDTSLAAATNGETWLAGEMEVRYIAEGSKVFIA